MKQQKSASNGLVKLDPKPKRTKQGDGLHSKASHGRKKSRGQGK